MANSNFLRGVDYHRQELVIDATLDIDSVGVCARLSGGAPFQNQERSQSLLKIAVIKD